VSEAKHTPGPWVCSQMESGGWKIHPADNPGFKICRIENAITYLMDFDEAAEPDARLIAAAPDLLAACQEFVRKVEAGEARSTKSYEQMKAAIAKADGPLFAEERTK
jgi:hypothetical protein